jgi:hypothetical protein
MVHVRLSYRKPLICNVCRRVLHPRLQRLRPVGQRGYEEPFFFVPARAGTPGPESAGRIVKSFSPFLLPNLDF